MFNQQLQQQQLQQQLQQQQLQQQQLQQQQQLLQLQQLLQPSPPQAPLPMPVSRGLPQQPSPQQLLNLQGTHSASLLNGSMLQRALLLQQLQGLDQFAMPPATYDSAGLTMPTAALGNLRAYNMTSPSLAAPSLTPPQMVTPNLQQFFPQATRQSLLGPPPVGVPMNPSQLSHSGRNSQKQARTSSSSTPNCKTVPLGDREDPTEGSEEASELQMDTPEDQDLLVCPDGMVSETPVPEPEPLEASEPAAKRSKSSEESTEKGPAGQPQAKVQPQTQMTAPKQTQTPERLPEPPGAQVLPHCQPQVVQIQAQVQPRLQKQAQTQTSPEHLAPQQNQVQPQVRSQPPRQVQPQETDPQKQAQTRTQTQTQVSAQAPPQEQLPGQRQEQTSEKTQDQPQTWPQGSAPQPEQASVPACATEPQPSSDAAEAAGGPEEALPEPVGAQSSADTSQEASAVGLDVGECEKRAGELLGMWGAGGSLKVTILQSSDSRAFNTTPLTSGPRPGDSTVAPALASTSSKQTLQFFCYICKASCSSQQEFQDHMSEAQHQQRLGEMQHSRQTCLLSLLPMPRDILEREAEEPPPKRWCNTCQVYYVGDLIQHRRTQEHKIAKQSLRPFCTICNRYFKTPRKFVEHVKSQGHKDKAKELKTLEKEIASPEEDHFITVDAVGCFESDQDEEEEEEEEEEIEAEEEFCKQVRSRDPSLEERKGSETYNPNTAYGVDFLVPVMGYVCRICHKFYDSNSGLRLSHCKSLAHFENLQKYKAAKNPSPASRPVSRKCAINARNALTALFTSNSGSGRPLSQPNPQDTAKLPSKVKPGFPNPPPPLRRSTRLKT
ncbi:cip1-interacting zinc finger protein isoform X2 [Peromyscus californicus insignis]|uniref:cip1-interacting zinc finger protein isoform X2 n=1 Tax=Peromyscus californicus insignis TaxID=564181 RepID=UPI0022A78AC3|nr:cip1-interacting zinc finger protein isoform X2 [Peromyscus californicus insignis]